MAQAETFSLPEVQSQTIAALVRAGFYSSKSDVAKEALRCLFEHKPTLKITAAIELYKDGQVSLGRAAELAEISTPAFKDALAERGIVREITVPEKTVQRGVAILQKIKR
ncbi:UPF0175 family protein [Candidatus Woesearchaeota archaeon]|nr:UPF0175 family protein [Candidatus Woesearchaeota archaeon]